VYDALLGGKNNFPADRKAAKQIAAAKPGVLANVRANRAFLGRSVRYLARDCGIRQFLDIGTGIPASDNTHEVAQSVAPDSKVVYVDNDPVVLAHARALLISAPAGTTAYLEADLREPSRILRDAGPTLDFRRPVAIMLLGILYMLRDDEDPYGIVARLVDAVTSGSYLVITHPASDVDPEAASRAAQRYTRLLQVQQTNRTQEQVRGFFEGLEILDPGVVQLDRWRPDPASPSPSLEISSWGGVGLKA
jgi:hypothetical protein